MDPADWYEEARRRAEMIDSPECTFTPIAPAPIRRKVTDIFVPVASTDKSDSNRYEHKISSSDSEGPAVPPARDEERTDKNHPESVSLLLGEAADYLSQHKQNSTADEQAEFVPN